MPLTVTDCTVTTKSITIKFSDAVDSQSGITLANYTLFAANSVDFNDAASPTIQDVVDENANKKTAFAVSANVTGNIVTFAFTPSSGKKEFQSGDWVNVVVRNVQGVNAGGLDGGFAMISGEVEGRGPTSRITRDVEDAISYPILTEEVAYRNSPVGGPSGGGIAGPGSGSLGQVAAKAVTDVLGWKVNSADPKGFIGALTQSFTLTDVEGHVESKWTPRTYAVQTDLGGGITGAQASLYMRAKDALDQSLSILDGLYPLDPEADPEYVKALREMARSQMTEIVKELGVVGLPSILRIDTYFGILLGQNPADVVGNNKSVQFDPDQITGTLGELRDTYGIKFVGNPFNNSVEDEQDITNFRVISDYMTSLMQSWIANRPFFTVDPNKQAFFGTQLVLISRQFNVITETVNEVRFALDSVFIGPNERQTLLLQFTDSNVLPSMFLEDILEEVENFAINEGPRLLRDGGKISVTNNVLPVVRSLKNLIEQAQEPENIDDLPKGFRTARVHNALRDLRDQLQDLINLTEQVEQQVPPPEDQFTVSSISTPEFTDDESGDATFRVIGNGFTEDTEVRIDSSTPVLVAGADVQFFSAQRIDVTIHEDWPGFSETADHDVTVINPDGESFTFVSAFTYDASTGFFSSSPRSAAAARRAIARKSVARSRPRPQGGTAATGSRAGRTVRPAGPAPSASEVANLHNRINDLHDAHKTFAQEIRDEFQKLKSMFAGGAKNQEPEEKKR